MKRENGFYLLTTLLAFFSALMLNNLYAADFLIDTAKNVVDSTSVNMSDFYHNGQLLNLASILPFHHHYQIWDTTTIHPYQYDLTKMPDTVMLLLADTSDCAFVPPVVGMLTSDFGQRSKIRYHYGIDLKLNTGDTVVSAFDGMVRISQYSPSYGYVVVVRHYNGLETVYGHLSSLKVKVGDILRAGDLVGLGGSTGHSTGPHLHFEMRYLGQPIDPNDIMEFNEDSVYRLKSDTLQICSNSFKYLADFKTSVVKYKNSRTYYTIRRGDTLSKIAQKNRTTVNRLCQINRMSRNTILRPGKRIRVR